LYVKEVYNYIKPELSEECKFKRLKWVLSFIENTADGIMFNNLENSVFLDEKWFILQKLKRLLKRFEDSPPENFSHTKSKSNPTCTAVTARPRNSEKSEEYFDGLVCLLLHIHWVAAQRRSVNRPRGALVAKPYTMNSENLYDGMMMEGGLIESIEDMCRLNKRFNFWRMNHFSSKNTQFSKLLNIIPSAVFSIKLIRTHFNRLNLHSSDNSGFM
jgi:hypothetical protein